MPIKMLADIGDCFEIPLGDGRSAYGQYVYMHPLYAGLVRVFDLFTLVGESPTKDDVLNSDLLFPPVFVGFNVPIRAGIWKKLFHIPVEDFHFPLFRVTSGVSFRLGTYDNWYLWDGMESRFVGRLPAEFQKLEYRAGRSSDSLEKRIRTGRDYPFDQMF